MEEAKEELQILAAGLKLTVGHEVGTLTEVGALMRNVFSEYSNPLLEEASGSMPKAPPG